MRIILTFIMVLLASNAAAEDDQSYEIGTGGHFLKICKEPASEICQTFIAGFLTGVVITQQESDDVFKSLKDSCANGKKSSCEITPNEIVTKLFQGCNFEISKMSLPEIVSLVSNFIESRKNSKDRNFGVLYRGAIAANFNCK